MEGIKESKDLTEKNLESFPDVFADILNVFIHMGSQKALPADLYPAPTETAYAPAGKALKGQLEDISKYEMRGGRIVTQYLLANQSEVDRGMVLRKAGYVGAAYREQYDGKVPGVFPVVELVLYWGQRSWNAARSIAELTAECRLDIRTGDLVDNLKICVYEMRRLPPEVRERFHSDMRHVVDYLAEGDAFRSDRPVIHKEALVRLLRALDGDQNVEDTAKILREINVSEEDEITMCELFEQYTRKGRKEGRMEGLKEGLKEGTLSALKNLMESQKWSVEQAMSAVGIPQEEYAYYKEAVLQT